MPTSIFHIQIKPKGDGGVKHSFASSILAIFILFDYQELGVSKHTLYKIDWEQNPVFENEKVIISKNICYSTTEARRKVFPVL